MGEMTAPLIAAEEVRKNFRKSILLIAVIAALIFGVSYLIGEELGDVETGLIIGAAVVFIVLPVQILTAKWAILGMTRGRAADPNDLRERRALHITEGLAVSAGLGRTPDLYIISTRVPNAFASGMGESDAFIGVTEGLLEMMDDQELEGVIAHEFGHIIHRDIMLNQLVVALISALLILAFILERVSVMNMLGGGRRRNSRDSGGGAVVLVIILLALLVRPLAYLISNLLQMAISRQREFAADAAAVRLCSYNEGLARALEKLGGKKEFSREEVDSLGGGSMAAMYINFPGEALFSTHPPIEKRVERLRNMY
ncbi:MAG: M48 family metalloprotease [Lentisphaeria bacterium]|nr:M48 family metalloprotease [Lentisphaeria bacterium]